jgi:hypothetical protein
MISNLVQLADRHYPADASNRKPAHYLDIYERCLAPVRGQPIRLLEIGIAGGASMRMWRDYLPRAQLVGLDVIERPTLLPASVTYIQGDQAGVQALHAARHAGPFDVIIDDAAHVADLAKASFEYLFPLALRSGGLYVVEDIGTGYMPEFRDGGPYADPPNVGPMHPSHHYGMVGWIKQLVDEMHLHALAHARARFAIESMQFHPHLVAIRKAAAHGTSPSGQTWSSSSALVAESMPG